MRECACVHVCVSVCDTVRACVHPPQAQVCMRSQCPAMVRCAECVRLTGVYLSACLCVLTQLGVCRSFLSVQTVAYSSVHCETCQRHVFITDQEKKREDFTVVKRTIIHVSIISNYNNQSILSLNLRYSKAEPRVGKL